jgi:hypothetical protein
MTADFLLSPCLIKGGIVPADPHTIALRSVIAFQYKPDSLTRTLPIQLCRAIMTVDLSTRFPQVALRIPRAAWHVIMRRRLKP